MAASIHQYIYIYGVLEVEGVGLFYCQLCCLRTIACRQCRMFYFAGCVYGTCQGIATLARQKAAGCCPEDAHHNVRPDS